MPSKRSKWYFDMTKVNVEGYTTEDVYTGVGLAPSGVTFKATQRVKTEQVAGIAALWGDVDVADPVHQKPNLPATYEAAYALIEQMPLMPTCVVNSGHGLQPWWFLEEPWIFEDDADRTLAAAISKAWNDELQRIAGESGQVVDSTHDLARVMRLPGTFNNKSEPVPVTVSQYDGARYKLSEIKALYTPSGGDDPDTYEGVPIDLASGEIPFQKWQALMELDPKFRRSWQRKRTDLVDQSQSSYDMSLASIASAAGWPPVEIAAMLKEHRILHGSADDPKLQRDDYYQRTIARAIKVDPNAEAQADLELALDEGGNQIGRQLHNLSSIFGIGEIRIKKYLGDPHTYRLECPAGEITLGSVDNITNQRKFRNHVADTTGRWIPGCDTAVWDTRVSALLLAAEDVDTGEAAHPSNMTYAWVQDYLQGKVVQDSLRDAFPEGQPFRDQGRIYLQLGELQQFLNSRGERKTTNELGRLLRMFGAMPHKFNGQVGGAPRTTKYFWQMPLEDVDGT
tara:strand:+ start:418 stop:1947 length:1530 start_codon:yes stop_codon:yes gene_type:complete